MLINYGGLILSNNESDLLQAEFYFQLPPGHVRKITHSYFNSPAIQLVVTEKIIKA